MESSFTGEAGSDRRYGDHSSQPLRTAGKQQVSPRSQHYAIQLD
jgi:hypothetical protein